MAGIFWMLVTGACFVVVTALVKYLGDGVPAAQAAFNASIRSSEMIRLRVRSAASISSIAARVKVKFRLYLGI